MKNLLYLIAVAIFITSCTVDPTSEIENQENLSFNIASENSNLGIYKGIFTTNNSLYRATVEVIIPQSSVEVETSDPYPKAKLTLHTGEIFTAKANRIIEKGETIVSLLFESADLSFSLSVNDNGSNPEVNDVIFQNLESNILVAKHSERAPVTPITGTYECSDCGGHPVLNNGGSQTFNILLDGDPSGSTTITTQISLGGAVFSGNGNQSGCVAMGTATSCLINGSFNSTNGGTIVWDGSHTFNNEATGPNDCSGVSGSWTWTSTPYGVITGSFISDVSCPITLAEEDFEDAAVTYTGPADDLGGILNEDYYGRVNLGLFDPGDGVFYDNIQGTNFYGAQDTDGNQTANPTSSVILLWQDIDVSMLSTITASAYFAEDDDGTNEDWDSDSSVRIQYSFNNTSWVPLVQIESSSPTNGANTAPRIDTNFDGTGDGAEITPTFTKYSGSFSTAGNPTVSIRLYMTGLGATDEDIAIDDLLVQGF